MFDYLFSFQGRTGRLGYLMFVFVWILLGFAFIVPATLFGMISPGLLFTFVIVYAAAMWVSSFAITFRRLHDMDLSGWVFVFVLVLQILVGPLLYFLKALYIVTDVDHLALLFQGAQAFIFIFYMMLLLWPGNDDSNRFEA